MLERHHQGSLSLCNATWTPPPPGGSYRPAACPQSPSTAPHRPTSQGRRLSRPDLSTPASPASRDCGQLQQNGRAGNKGEAPWVASRRRQLGRHSPEHAQLPLRAVLTRYLHNPAQAHIPVSCHHTRLVLPSGAPEHHLPPSTIAGSAPLTPSPPGPALPLPLPRIPDTFLVQ